MYRFFLKMGHPRPLFHLFSSFQTNITNFTTNKYVKKWPSSIWCWDSNSRPLEHLSPPITTRPGLRDSYFELWFSVVHKSAKLWLPVGILYIVGIPTFIPSVGWGRGTSTIVVLVRRFKWEKLGPMLTIHVSKGYAYHMLAYHLC